MINKKFISDHDIELFQEALKHIQPLKQKNKKLDTAPQPTSSFIQPSFQPINLPTPHRPPSLFLEELLNKQTEAYVTAQDSLFFCRSGLQSKPMQKLKKGLTPIKATIDLHGMRLEQALQCLEHFFYRELQESSPRYCVCVIHGKGQGFPVLKNLVNRFLKQESRVLAFCSAPAHLGGTGATLVLLKSTLPSKR